MCCVASASTTEYTNQKTHASHPRVYIRDGSLGYEREISFNIRPVPPSSDQTFMDNKMDVNLMFQSIFQFTMPWETFFK